MTACPETDALSSQTEDIRFILELGDFRTFSKADPFPGGETWRENRAGGNVMRKRYFLPNDYLEELSMVCKYSLRSTSTKQTDKNNKKRTFKNLEGCFESVPGENSILMLQCPVVSGKH